MWDVIIRYVFMILLFWWVQMFVCVLHTEGSFWTSEKYVMWRSRLTHCLQVCLWRMIESLYLLGSDGVKQQKIGYGHLPFTICGDKCMYDNNILIHGCMGAFVPHVFSFYWGGQWDPERLSNRCWVICWCSHSWFQRESDLYLLSYVA